MPWATLWHSNLCIRIRITPPASEGYLLLSVCTGESTYRCVSGFCGPETLDVESVPSPEGRGEWIHVRSQVADIVVMDSGSEHCDECSTGKQGEQVLYGSHPVSHLWSTERRSKHKKDSLDKLVHPVFHHPQFSRYVRRFDVSAGVGAVSIPIWGSMAFQSGSQENQCPTQPAPNVARFSPAREGLATPTAYLLPTLALNTVRTAPMCPEGLTLSQRCYILCVHLRLWTRKVSPKFRFLWCFGIPVSLRPNVELEGCALFEVPPGTHSS